MAEKSLEQLLASMDNPALEFRRNDYFDTMYDFPDEYSNWIAEQRAVRESCFIVDQSYHMTPLYLTGSDALEVLKKLGTNSFDSFENGTPPQAKNLVLCNHDGYLIRDTILFHMDENSFVSAGTEIPTNWMVYHIESWDYDVSYEVPYQPGSGNSPRELRFQIQGPNAPEVMDTVVDGGLPDIPFFKMANVSIDGVDIAVLRHGMAGAPGFEIMGPFEHHDAVEERILDVGGGHGIRQMGSMAYKTGKIGIGWIHQPVPAIYDSARLKGYREWLGVDGPEANMSIGGSFKSEEISDYYMEPFESGQGHLVNFDHDFIGKEALQEMAENPRRERVTFVWDSEDVVDIYASLFTEGETYKFVHLPDTARQWSLTNYDKVMIGDDLVGISKYPGYLSYERAYLSLGVIDCEHSEPGTEVTVIWGEVDSEKRKVERHVEKEVRATVAPSPYIDGGRQHDR